MDRHWRFNPGCATEPCCGTCGSIRVSASGCGPSGAIGNPTVHPVPGAVVTLHKDGVFISQVTADSLGVATLPYYAAGNYVVSGTGTHLAGSLAPVARTCDSPVGHLSLLMTPVADHACLRGVHYRPLQRTLYLTDSHGTRAILYGQNLRGTKGVIWDVCSVISSTHAEGGDCALATADVRMMYEFGSRLDNVSGLWQPALSQIWKANVCHPPNKYTILAGGTCPPPFPPGEADFTSSSGMLAANWSPGPPFTATFEFPDYTFTLGSMISEHWLPVSGTVTISEAP